MKIVCAWCQKDLGEKEPLEDKNVTHGICVDCLIKANQEIEELHTIHTRRTDV